MPFRSPSFGSKGSRVRPKGVREGNFRFTLAYEGTHLEGWQRQPKGRTVQAEVEHVLQRIIGEKVRVTGAGRTDSGVHAQGQVAHAFLRTRLSPTVLARAMNALLPEDILVRSVQKVPARFHARYDARGKQYRYTLWNHPLRPLLNRQRLTHISEPLNLAAMRQAARRLQGRRDFSAFQSSGRSARSTVRHLRKLTLRRQGPLLTIDAQGDGFLYHMVRRLAGQLIEIGKGRSPKIAPTAPARGLCLMKVYY